MPRRGRSPSPSSRYAPAPRTTLPARAPPSAVAHPPSHPPAMAAPQQPSLFGQMAATAGGVAVGSAIGHTIGHAATGLFSGGGGSEPAPVPQQQQQTASGPYQQSYDETGPCAWEIKQFLQCASNQSDLTLCQGFNEAMQQCKFQNNMA